MSSFAIRDWRNDVEGVGHLLHHDMLLCWQQTVTPDRIPVQPVLFKAGRMIPAGSRVWPRSSKASLQQTRACSGLPEMSNMIAPVSLDFGGTGSICDIGRRS
jgi:hypothetical protein